MTRRQAINFMISIAENHDDGISVNLTRLAEECAVEFHCADEGGPLDDPAHEIWEWAVDAADHYDRHLRAAS